MECRRHGVRQLVMDDLRYVSEGMFIDYDFWDLWRGSATQNWFLSHHEHCQDGYLADERYDAVCTRRL